MLKQIKRSVLNASKRIGAFDVLKDSDWRGKRLLILAYHGVAIDDEHLWRPELYVTSAVLEERFRLLKDGGYTVLPLDEAVQRLAADRLPPRSVALTFDDGFADFALKAHPLLTRYGFPATVYLTTYYSSFNRPVFGLFCSYVLWKSARHRVRSTEFVSDLPDEEWDLQDSSDRDWAHQAIVSHAERNGLSAAEKDDLARRVADVVEVDYDDLGDRRILRLMNPDEVASLARSGIDFQLHTHRHRTPLDEALFTREIDDNRRSLQEMTGQAASHFCYPSGVHDAAFFPWLKQSGVVSATTCDTGIASRDTDPLLLPRVIDTMNLSPIEFEGWISGAGAFLPLRPHHPTHG